MIKSNVFILAIMGVMLCLKKDDDLHIGKLPYSLKFTHSKAQDLSKTFSSFFF